MYDYAEIEDLIGKTIESIETNGNEEIIFNTTDGDSYKMYHQQDCCEYVSLQDVAGGDLSDLIGETIITAYASSKQGDETSDDNKFGDESYTWTFYTIRTNAVTLTLRWYGSSNGYYSESVDFVKL